MRLRLLELGSLVPLSGERLVDNPFVMNEPIAFWAKLLRDAVKQAFHAVEPFRAQRR